MRGSREREAGARSPAWPLPPPVDARPAALAPAAVSNADLEPIFAPFAPIYTCVAIGKKGESTTGGSGGQATAVAVKSASTRVPPRQPPANRRSPRPAGTSRRFGFAKFVDAATAAAAMEALQGQMLHGKALSLKSAVALGEPEYPIGGGDRKFRIAKQLKGVGAGQLLLAAGAGRQCSRQLCLQRCCTHMPALPARPIPAVGGLHAAGPVATHRSHALAVCGAQLHLLAAGLGRGHAGSPAGTRPLDAAPAGGGAHAGCACLR